MRFNKVAAALAFVSGLAFATGTSATEISDSFNFSEATVDVDQTGTLDLFDTSLGTLTTVVLEIRGYATSEISLQNLSTSSQTVTASTSVNMFFNESDLGVDLGLADPLFDLNMSTGSQVIGPAELTVFGPLTDTQSFSLSLTSADGALFTAFQSSSPDTFDLNCSSLTGIFLVGGGGNISVGTETTAGCGATVTYTFDSAVPVPAPLALLTLGLAGISYCRRKQNKMMQEVT